MEGEQKENGEEGERKWRMEGMGESSPVQSSPVQSGLMVVPGTDLFVFPVDGEDAGGIGRVEEEGVEGSRKEGKGIRYLV